MTFQQTLKLLDIIRQKDDLVKFQKENIDDISKKYNIKDNEFNFLIGIVVNERIKEKLGQL
jgi:tellurite resistance protein